MTALQEPGLFVGGAWRPPGGTYETVNPARPHERIGCFGAASPADVADAFEAARVSEWRRWGEDQRAAVLQRAAALVDERAEELARLVTAEEGKTIRDARGEARRTAEVLRYFAGECAQPVGEVYASASSRFLSTRRVPVGVVCAITPWNLPLAIPAWKIAPALAFGNTVVWKPAASTPSAAVRLTAILQEAGLPAGALNLLTGSSGRIGDALVAPGGADAVTFTGSTAVGRRIRRQLAGGNAKLQLQLGGKNPAVVLADADVDLAAREITKAAMLQTGQRCTATSRVLVERPLFERLLDRLDECARALVVGDPEEETTDVGPLASHEQFATVVGYLERASELGLEVRTGGSWGDPERGYFVNPTVIVDPRGDSPLSREEVFGPVACVTPVADAAEGLRLANDTPYGLSASVFTRSLESAMRFAEGLEAGVVHVNGESTGAEPHVPFGGMKASSSHSREQGRAAREFFTQVKTVYVHSEGTPQ